MTPLKVKQAISYTSKVVIGSYTGNGTSKNWSKRKITYSSIPKCIIIVPNGVNSLKYDTSATYYWWGLSESLVFIYGQSKALSLVSLDTTANPSVYYVDLSWTSTYMEFGVENDMNNKSSYAVAGFNVSGMTYYYAILY